jgi:hypothetical protein
MAHRTAAFHLVLLLSFLGAVLLATGVVLVEGNTPPEVVLDTPSDGARLSATVLVTGTASDAEGFNVSSLVEMRWNDWEWFAIASTPAGGGLALYFGESVDLSWHSPGEHSLCIRAYDGDLHSEVVNLSVTVRDLPDIVILPNGIRLDPVDAGAGDEADIVVTVENKGGEDVPDVEVVLRSNDREVGRNVIVLLPAGGSVDVTFSMGLEVGNMTVLATANAKGQVQERSAVNNDAEQTFAIMETDRDVGNWHVLVAIVVVIVFLLLLGLGWSSGSGPRKP